jgi:hypothetical protein
MQNNGLKQDLINAQGCKMRKSAFKLKPETAEILDILFQVILKNQTSMLRKVKTQTF